MGRREEETRKAIKEAKKETFIGTKEKILLLICMLPKWIKKILLRYKTERNDKK